MTIPACILSSFNGAPTFHVDGTPPPHGSPDRPIVRSRQDSSGMEHRRRPYHGKIWAIDEGTIFLSGGHGVTHLLGPGSYVPQFRFAGVRTWRAGRAYCVLSEHATR